jgi:hypothetical protein
VPELGRKILVSFTFWGDVDQVIIERLVFNLNSFFAEIGGIQALIVIAAAYLNSLLTSVRAKANIASTLFWKAAVSDTPKDLKEKKAWLDSTQRLKVSFSEVLALTFCWSPCRSKKNN